MRMESSTAGKWAFVTNDNKSDNLYIREIGRTCSLPGIHRINAREPYVLQYLVDGEVIFNGTHINVGDGFLIYPGDEVTVEVSKKNPPEYYWIMFGGSDAPDILADCGIELKTHVFSAPFFENLRDDFELVLSFYRSGNRTPFDYPLIMKGIFYKLLAYHSAAKKKLSDFRKNNYVEAAVGFIKNHYSERINIEDIAAAIHISSRYMYKLFMSELGYSPKQILTKQRIDRAAHLLTTTEMTICEIAHQVGYSEQSQLSAAFRYSYGISPSSFRSNSKQNSKR